MPRKKKSRLSRQIEREKATGRYEFYPDRTHLLSAMVMECIFLLMVGAAPQYTFWILFLPFIFVYWVLRSKTIVSPEGITTRPAFSSSHHFQWEEIQGVRFGGWSTYLRPTGHEDKTRDVAMPGVSFNSIPRLAEASQGRIPDVVEQGRLAAADKVVVVRMDGRQILTDKQDAEQRTSAALAKALRNRQPAHRIESPVVDQDVEK